MDRNRHGLLSPSTLLVAIDDTDTVDSEYGTGRVSRFLGDHLAEELGEFRYRASVRQQLLVDPRVPYTTHNSAACLVCTWEPERDRSRLVETAAAFLADIAAPGSDPGLGVARVEDVPEAVRQFGQEASEVVLEKAAAYDVADGTPVFLDEYGGTGDGVIGALAAVGRTATGEMGRLIDFGEIRSFEGTVPVASLRESGLHVVTEAGTPVREGTVETGGWVRPLLRDGAPTLEVESRANGRYRPTNLDA